MPKGGANKAALVGYKSGKLEVVEALGTRGSGENSKAIWRCRCECGNEVIIASAQLLNTKRPTRSCGCLRKIAYNLKHGNTSKEGKRSLTPEYRAWIAMNSRCSNPNSKDWIRYGGRGIKVCNRWKGEHGFENFLVDVGSKPKPYKAYSIDREDNDGNYEATNCRWATWKQQANNKSKA